MNAYPPPYRMQSNRGRFSRRARVELLPLIDVMFLLVAFFMIISISMVVQQGIFVDLSPSASGASLNQDVNSLVVSVRADGELFLNKKPITAPALLAQLQTLTQRKSTTPQSVIINADKNTRHSSVISALDIVRRSGVESVVFSVEPEAAD